jgi:hypothetical protein
MKTTNNNQQVQNTSNLIFVQPKSVRVKNDYLLIQLEDGKMIRKHINYFKQILGVPFTPVPKDATQEAADAVPQAQVG